MGGDFLSEINWIQWIQKQVIATLRYTKREKIVFYLLFLDKGFTAYMC